MCMPERSIISESAESIILGMISAALPTIPILPSFMETTALSIVSPETVWAVAPTRKIGWSCAGAVGVRSWARAVDVKAVVSEAAMSVGMYFMVGAFMMGGLVVGVPVWEALFAVVGGEVWVVVVCELLVFFGCFLLFAVALCVLCDDFLDEAGAFVVNSGTMCGVIFE